MKPSIVVASIFLALCSGCGSTAGSTAGAGNTGSPTGFLTRALDTADCKAAPPQLIAAIEARMGSFTLTHPFMVGDGDYQIVAGRLEGPGRSGTDIATFAVKGAEDPTTATIYALGPNAAQSSDWEDAGADVDLPVSLDDAGAVAATGCAMAG